MLSLMTGSTAASKRFSRAVRRARHAARRSANCPWIDFDRKVAIVLLSNRVHPTRNNPRWNPVRARIADLVMTTLFEDVR